MLKYTKYTILKGAKMANYKEHVTVRIDEETSEKINLIFKIESNKSKEYKVRKQDVLRKILSLGVSELEKEAANSE